MTNYNRERALYNRAFGRFISKHSFVWTHWLLADEQKEYAEIQKENK